MIFNKCKSRIPQDSLLKSIFYVRICDLQLAIKIATGSNSFTIKLIAIPQKSFPKTSLENGTPPTVRGLATQGKEFYRVGATTRNALLQVDSKCTFEGGRPYKQLTPQAGNSYSSISFSF